MIRIDCATNRWIIDSLDTSYETIRPGANGQAWTGYTGLDVDAAGNWKLTGNFRGTQYYSGTAFFKWGNCWVGTNMSSGALNPVRRFYKVGIFTE